VCDSAATRPSSQITLGKLVNYLPRSCNCKRYRVSGVKRRVSNYHGNSATIRFRSRKASRHSRAKKLSQLS